MAAAMANNDDRDSWKVHFADTMRGGQYVNNWRMAEIHAHCMQRYPGLKSTRVMITDEHHTKALRTDGGAQSLALIQRAAIYVMLVAEDDQGTPIELGEVLSGIGSLADVDWSLSALEAPLDVLHRHLQAKRHAVPARGGVHTVVMAPELAGMLAHEAGHIRGGHLARREEALRKATIEAIVACILGVGAAAGSGCSISRTPSRSNSGARRFRSSSVSASLASTTSRVLGAAPRTASGHTRLRRPPGAPMFAGMGGTHTSASSIMKAVENVERMACARSRASARIRGLGHRSRTDRVRTAGSRCSRS